MFRFCGEGEVRLLINWLVMEGILYMQIVMLFLCFLMVFEMLERDIFFFLKGMDKCLVVILFVEMLFVLLGLLVVVRKSLMLFFRGLFWLENRLMIWLRKRVWEVLFDWILLLGFLREQRRVILGWGWVVEMWERMLIRGFMLIFFVININFLKFGGVLLDLGEDNNSCCLEGCENIWGGQVKELFMWMWMGVCKRVEGFCQRQVVGGLRGDCWIVSFMWGWDGGEVMVKLLGFWQEGKGGQQRFIYWLGRKLMGGWEGWEGVRWKRWIVGVMGVMVVMRSLWRDQRDVSRVGG